MAANAHGPHPDEPPAPRREKLDVEDEDARQQRIQSLLESTNAPSASGSAPHLPPGLVLPPSKPHAVPVSSLLSRAEDFLPRLAASNAELANKAAQDPASVDIEHLGDRGEEAPHIEMNLGLGVFSQRPPPSAKRTSTSTSSPDPSPTLRSPATGTTAPTTLATYSSASSATTSSDEDDESDESNDEHSDDEDSDDGSVISALPPDEARALEALLSPRPIPSSRFQQQQQQQPTGGIPGTESADSAGPDAASQTEPEEQKAAAAGGTSQQGRKPSMVVLTSGMDIDMDTGPQTARGWEEE